MTAGRFSVLFRPEVETDLRYLDRSGRERLLNAIEERLAADPESFGKPLRGRLAGLRRIRVGDYRVAFQVRRNDVIIWAVRHRKDIYPELARRLQRRDI